MPNIAPRYWLMIAILGFVWGGTFLLIKLALEGTTPFWLAASRIGFAALLLCAIWGIRGFKLFKDQTNWPSLILIGVLSTALPFMLISWGQQHVSSGFTGISMAAIPLMVLPLAHVFIPGEQMTLRRLIGFCIGFVGVALLIGGKAFTSSGSELESYGRAACLSSAACYSVSSILTRRLPPVDPLGLAAILLVIGSTIIVPVAWMAEGPPVVPDNRTLLIAAVLGLIPTAAANLLRVIVVREAGPTFMTLTNYQVPIWAVVLGAVFLGEELPPSMLLAMTLILGGLGLSQFGRLKRLFGGTQGHNP
ncbi:DMT family transporter [Phaeobacter gallaeciensis]|uniref:Permease of the drug/metabolite transporter (DMT) superfamily protein n=1 Tax=Phaeobacter gallaeciensis TaxID=60890 RepID=A0AAD0ECB2_9RHOB|nr:DMT family transporter [Phaeobacter gallaeciensis]AHD10580.1 Permease of the drug/metabolite transporter (DMT) superfamily [Phaeobacter gallaeciensis DSM 26640]ATE93843.1 Permease of the drug/metabolite transporter (DMT) superfamily protein [Phaeobacter gallaeciensis]ATE96336.1 Permease of the drug/metabolite transporter (DMT) superfamily protein [Phaeobacter gallaeciensis]ATF02507.1 Permease of the drug/metabolite transporter (DMT) superfamily protein [Phaeobacter gallaeciensis]ATF06887.1 